METSLDASAWLNLNRFSLSHWNVHLIDGPRTNNNLEAWHGRVTTLAGEAHLNIFDGCYVIPTRPLSKNNHLPGCEPGIKNFSRDWVGKD